MRKGKKYQTESATHSQAKKERKNIYQNTQIGNIPYSREDDSIYEIPDTYEGNTAEFPKQTSEESPWQSSSEPKPQIDVVVVRSIRRLQVLCMVLLVAIIIMAATFGSMMSDQNKRLDSTEGKTDQLHSEKDHIRAENKSVVIQKLDFKITQLESNQKSIDAAFRNYTAEARHVRRRVIQLESDRRHDLATFQNYDMRTTELETKSNSYSERMGDQSSRISALEGLPMIGFTAKGRKNHLNGTLIYNSILSEVGGGFNTSTGVFTCPVAGLYLVSMMLQVESDGQINCWLYINGAKTSLEIDITGNGQELASQTAVFKLSKGESLYVGSCDEDNIGDETTFTVVLIQADT